MKIKKLKILDQPADWEKIIRNYYFGWKRNEDMFNLIKHVIRQHLAQERKRVRERLKKIMNKEPRDEWTTGYLCGIDEALNELEKEGGK